MMLEWSMFWRFCRFFVDGKYFVNVPVGNFNDWKKTVGVGKIFVGIGKIFVIGYHTLSCHFIKIAVPQSALLSFCSCACTITDCIIVSNPQIIKLTFIILLSI
jgi:hypothetical protein